MRLCFRIFGTKYTKGSTVVFIFSDAIVVRSESSTYMYQLVISITIAIQWVLVTLRGMSSSATSFQEVPRMGFSPPTVLHQLLWTLKHLQLVLLHGHRITTADRLCPVENGHVLRKDVGALLAPLPHQVHDFIKMLQAFNQTLKLNKKFNGITKYYDLTRNS